MPHAHAVLRLKFCCPNLLQGRMHQSPLAFLATGSVKHSSFSSEQGLVTQYSAVTLPGVVRTTSWVMLQMRLKLMILAIWAMSTILWGQSQSSVSFSMNSPKTMAVQPRVNWQMWVSPLILTVACLSGSTSFLFSVEQVMVSMLEELAGVKLPTMVSSFPGSSRQTLTGCLGRSRLITGVSMLQLQALLDLMQKSWMAWPVTLASKVSLWQEGLQKGLRPMIFTQFLLLTEVSLMLEGTSRIFSRFLIILFLKSKQLQAVAVSSSAKRSNSSHSSTAPNSYICFQDQTQRVSLPYTMTLPSLQAKMMEESEVRLISQSQGPVKAEKSQGHVQTWAQSGLLQGSGLGQEHPQCLTGAGQRGASEEDWPIVSVLLVDILWEFIWLQRQGRIGDLKSFRYRFWGYPKGPHTRMRDKEWWLSWDYWQVLKVFLQKIATVNAQSLTLNRVIIKTEKRVSASILKN